MRLFDAVVLGDGMGGLVAGLMLQKRKAKVAVLRKRLTSHLDPALCEFLNGFALKPVLKRMGFHPTEVNAIPPLDAPLQLIFADHRIDCYGEEGRFERELVREFPGTSKKILQLFRESYGHIEIYQHLLNSRVPLPPRGFFARRQFKKELTRVCDVALLEDRLLKKELESFEVGGEFGRAIEAMRLSFTQLLSPWTCGAQLAHLLTLVRWEGYSAPGGLLTIRNLLLDRIKERGGVLVDADEIHEVRIKRRRVTAFGLTGSEFSELGCTAVIVGGNPRGFIAMAPDEKPMKQWRKLLDQLPVKLRKAYQLYRLSAGGVPIGMKSQGLIIPPPVPNGSNERRRFVRAIRYTVRRKVQEGKAPEIWFGLTAFLSLDGEPEPARVREEIREGVRQAVPFLEQHLLEEPSAVFMTPLDGSPGDFSQGFVYECEKPRDLGIAGLTPETPFQNVFMAGDVVFPGLGLDGELIAGLQCTHYAGTLIHEDRQLAD
ncbi:MAG: hypothetical protein V1798_03860 [Pseudomonadota bacterium]